MILPRAFGMHEPASPCCSMTLPLAGLPVAQLYSVPAAELRRKRSAGRILEAVISFSSAAPGSCKAAPIYLGYRVWVNIARDEVGTSYM
jgi:hypothetical protein